MAVFVLIRAIVYATCFIAFVLIFVPARLLDRSGIIRRSGVGVVELAGAVIAVLGAVLALWCIFTFVFIGRGTPAPFDPPRRLVVRGPYRLLRNPMYVGAALTLAGAAVVFHSLVLLGYLALLAVIVQAMVVWYEEPTLRRLFGAEYDEYRRHVHRWLPRQPSHSRCRLRQTAPRVR
jgi:protein-S-isoprenylcysteine O-methyltransferase Ste14